MPVAARRSSVAELPPQLKADLKAAGESIRKAQAGERLDKTTLETLYTAFKTVAASCPEKSADGGPLLNRELFAQIVVEVVGEVEKRVVDKLFRAVDEDGSGFVDFGEFVGSARMLTADMAAQAEQLPPELDEAARVAFELVDERLELQIPLGQGLDRVFRLLSVEAEEVDTLQRLKAYAENPELMQDGQEPVDSLWLKRYTNTVSDPGSGGLLAVVAAV